MVESVGGGIFDLKGRVIYYSDKDGQSLFDNGVKNFFFRVFYDGIEC